MVQQRLDAHPEKNAPAAGNSGADPIETREGFSQILDRIESSGVSVAIVEDASHFARV